MNSRIVLLLTAVVLPTASAAQQGNTPRSTLRAFRSDRELVHYLQILEGRPAPTPRPEPQSTVPTIPCTNAPGNAPASVTGRVTNAQGQPEAAVLVRIRLLGVGASTHADGTYRVAVPGNRTCPGHPVQITASRVGLGPVGHALTLSPGAGLTQNFQMAAQAIRLYTVVVPPTAGAAQSITSNQQEGVGEGGIVKRQGDFLVILRRGRLFTVDARGSQQRPVSTVDAHGEDGDSDAWYNEMLVSGETVVVIGYSHKHDATEIGLFHIDREGRLRYRETWHLRNGDYHAPRNFASRLIGTRLVMYSTLHADTYDDDVDAWMPAIRRWRPDDAEGEGGFRRVLRAGRVYGPGRPLHAMDVPMLHTVTNCELGGGGMECQATALLGPESPAVYVSPTAAYVWASDWMRERERVPSTLYRIPLDGSPPSALGAQGRPADQFSFMESGDGFLSVLVRFEGNGGALWSAEGAGDNVRLLRVPLSRFGGARARARDADYHPPPSPEEGS